MTAWLRTDDEAIQRDVRRLAAGIADMWEQRLWLVTEASVGEYLRLGLVNEQAQEVATIAARARRRYELRKGGEQ